jgi:hypothetical protein
MSRKRDHGKAAASATSEGRGYQYLEHQAWMLTPPWIVLVVLVVAGGVLHLALRGDPMRLAWGVFGLTTGTTVLAAVAAVVGRARGGATQAYAVITVITAGLWLVVSTIVGLGVLGLDLAAALIGAVGALAWNLRHLLRGAGDSHGHSRAQSWADMADEVKTLRGAIRERRTEGATHEVTLELPPGMTAQEAQQDVPRIAQLLRIPATGARMTPDPDDAGVVTLRITPEDMLRHTIHWPGPTAAGRSIAEPISLGRYEDGQDLTLTLPGVAGRRPLSHIILVGMTGAGKSELLQVLVAESATRIDCVLDYLDVAGKAEQTVAPLKRAIRTLVTDKKSGAAYLKRRLAEVPDRARALAAVGMREWQPGAPVPFEILVIDEGASLVAESDDFVEMARVLRSVGILLVLAIQRITYDQMPTSARANFGTVACFGVRTSADAGMTLSPETIDAGAAPEQWRNRRPGYLYLEAPGIDEERYSMPARAYLAKADDVQRIIEQAAPLRWSAEPQPTPGGRDAARLAAQARIVASTALAEPAEEAEIVDDDQGDEPTPAYAPPAHLAEQLAGVDPDAELADIPGVDMAARIGPPERVPPLTPAQAEEALDAFLAEFRAIDPGQFQRRDLIEAGALQVCGRGKSWLSEALGRRVDAGAIERVGEACDGVYAWAPALAGR